MLLTILHKKTPTATIAFCKVSIKFGFATSTITGSMEVTKESKVGDEVEISNDTKVSVRQSTSEDGHVFDWLVLSN
jgi:hypothetical protein